MAAAAVVAAPVGWLTSGRAGLGCVIAAAGVCALSGGAALWVGELFRQPQQALVGLAFGLFLRMAPPLAFCAALYLRGGALAEAGLAFYIIVFYLFALLVGTLLSTPGGAPAPKRR